MLPESDRDKRNPENVAYVERARGDGPPRRVTGKAVVVAKRNPLRPEVVYAVDDEHSDPLKTGVSVS